MYDIYKRGGFSDEEAKEYLMNNYQIDSTKLVRKSDYEAICEHFAAGKDNA